MQKWKPDSWREQRGTVPALATQEFSFTDTSPNHVIFSNNGADILYMSVSAGVGTAVYDIIIPAYGVKLFCRMQSMKYVYCYNPSLAPIDLFIQSFEGDFNPASISQTAEVVSRAATGILGTIIVDSITIPVVLGTGAALIGKVDINNFSQNTPLQVVLAAGVQQIIKATAGFVFALSNAPADLLLGNGANTVWAGQYLAANPIYCNADIRLVSALGGTAYIVYK
jgi:hypothetical protein